MRKREHVVFTCIFFAVLSILFLFFAKTGFFASIRSVSEIVLKPFQSFTFSVVQQLVYPANASESQQKKLQEVNQIVDLSKVEKDNKALLDQFQTTSPSSQHLLPARVIGMPSFIPNSTVVGELILAVGKADGIETGEAVVYKNNLVGKIQTASSHISLVQTVLNDSFSSPAKTTKTDALGVLRGIGKDTMVFGNVTLSDELSFADILVSSANVSENGIGIPSDLVFGTVENIDKKPSDLFQSATIKSLLDFQRLRIVFVITNK